MCTTDAQIALIMQGVIGHLSLKYVLPDLLLAPESQRIDLHKVPARVPFDRLGVGSCGGLVAAYGGHPGPAALERLLQGLDFAQPAAEVRVARPQAFAVELFLRFGGDGGLEGAYLYLVTLLYAAAQFVGFREEKVCVDKEDIELRVDLCGDVYERRAFCAEAGCDGYAVGEFGKRPLQNLARRS
jgi:hypothetical protein